MSNETHELALRYGVAWAAHDLDAIMAMHTDDTVFHLHGGGEPRWTLRPARHLPPRRPVARHSIREEQGLHRRCALRQRVPDERNRGRQASHLRRRRRDRGRRRSHLAEGHLPRLAGHPTAAQCGDVGVVDRVSPARFLGGERPASAGLPGGGTSQRGRRRSRRRLRSRRPRRARPVSSRARRWPPRTPQYHVCSPP